MIVAGMVLLSCGPGTQAPAGPTNPYDRAKEAFKGGEWDKAVDLTEKLAIATPPVDSTDRARVMRAVIFTGQLRGAKEVAEAYGKGAQKQSGYRRLQHDILVSATKAALSLAGTAQQIAPDGVISKELILDVSYPTIEGPPEVKELATVQDGTWIESDQQDTALANAYRKGVDDALANALGGDRAKARQALAGGPAKLEGASFAIFLASGLTEAAVVFDHHHSLDPAKLRAMCDEGEASLKAASAILKDSPDKDLQKQIKQLQDKFKTIRKSIA
jgi:hypothetical protein